MGTIALATASLLCYWGRKRGAVQRSRLASYYNLASKYEGIPSLAEVRQAIWYSVDDLTSSPPCDSPEHVGQMHPRSRRPCRRWTRLLQPPRPQGGPVLT